MSNPTAAMLVIGDEILSGRTRDANMHFLSRSFAAHGIDLYEARVVRDEAAAIVGALNALREAYDIVVTSGGIGPTHDDITADCVACAFGVEIGHREDAMALLAAHYKAQGKEFNAARQRMARIPKGARLIENSVSIAPGFSLGNVHVLAGVPAVFQAMVEALLPGLGQGRAVISRSLRIERGEGEIAAPLAELAGAYDDLTFGSYPFEEDGFHGANIVIRGSDADMIEAALGRLCFIFNGSENV